ncbi:GAF domain-containing sensor histidine kinase [Candidatus Gracilibacteria bacterium]|nr:GAF domain-containing sensor histidine kinase [Candidatus Gracilibacteria bacterium]
MQTEYNEQSTDTIAYAREMRMLYRDAERRAVRFRLLVEMGRDLASVRDPQALLQLAVSRTTTFSGYSNGCVLLCSANDELVARATTGMISPFTRLRSGRAGWAEAMQALHEGRALVEPAIALTAGESPPIPSRIFLPLITNDGQALGVLLLCDDALAHPLDSEDLHALHLLAGQLATALQSAQLHSEKEQLAARLSEREQRLTELVNHLMHAQEEERRRIAYELHDGLSQMTVGILQQLHILEECYKPRAHRSQQALARAVEMARATVTEARRTIAGLRPTVLDDFGLVTAVHMLASELQAEGWDVTCTIDVGGPNLPSAIETALYRIVQELLTNIRKHAGQTRVHITLYRSGDAVALCVQDWGQGFIPDATIRPVHTGEKIGLSGIRDRVWAFDGQWHLESAPGQGTLVQVALTLPQLQPLELTGGTRLDTNRYAYAGR